MLYTANILTIKNKRCHCRTIFLKFEAIKKYTEKVFTGIMLYKKNKPQTNDYSHYTVNVKKKQTLKLCKFMYLYINSCHSDWKGGQATADSKLLMNK